MTTHLRRLIATSLILCAVLSVVWTLLLPEHLEDPRDHLIAIADAGLTGDIALMLLALSQLAFMVGFAGVTAWLHPSSPRLATIGGTLAVLGGFGHAVHSGAEMARQTLASDPDGHAAIAGRLLDSPALMPFMMIGLVGTVAGLVLLGIAHLRSRAAPRWTGPVLVAFVLVEFIGSNVSPWSTYLAGLLLLVACGGLASGLIRPSRSLTGDETVSTPRTKVKIR